MGFFVVLAAFGLLGVFVILLDSFEPRAIRRFNARRSQINRERLERSMADYEQRRVYDQDNEAA